MMHWIIGFAGDLAGMAMGLLGIAFLVVCAFLTFVFPPGILIWIFWGWFLKKTLFSGVTLADIGGKKQ